MRFIVIKQYNDELHAIVGCPHCLSTNVKIEHISCPCVLRPYFIVCEDCGYSGKSRATARRAVKAWNRRASNDE